MDFSLFALKVSGYSSLGPTRFLSLICVCLSGNQKEGNGLPCKIFELSVFRLPGRENTVIFDNDN